MGYKLNIVHKKYYLKKTIHLCSVELVETYETAAYDYDRGTAWTADNGDWTSTYRMAAYFMSVETRTIYESLSTENQKELATQLAAEWHTYADYYTMKLKLTKNGNTVVYDLSKSGIVGSGHCYGALTMS